MTGGRVLVVLTALTFAGGCGSGDTATENLGGDTTGQVPLVNTETLKLHRHERSSIAFETTRQLDEAMGRENREG